MGDSSDPHGPASPRSLGGLMRGASPGGQVVSSSVNVTLVEEPPGPEKFSYAITAAKRSEQRKLINFVRLADYIICDALHLLLVDSLEDLLRRMAHESMRAAVEATKSTVSGTVEGGDMEERRGSTYDNLIGEVVDGLERRASYGEGAPGFPEKTVRRHSSIISLDFRKEEESEDGKPLFVVDIVIENDQLVFSPSPVDFDQKIGRVITGMLEALGIVGRLLNKKQLASIMDQNNDAEGSGSLIELMGDDKQTELSAGIKDSFTFVFQDAEEFKRSFQPYMELCIANQTVTEEAMRQQEGVLWDQT